MNLDKQTNPNYTFVINTIKGERHEGYDEKVKRQKWYDAVVDGKGYTDYLGSNARRETEEQLEIRKKLTIPVTPSILGKVQAFISPALRQPKRKNKIDAEEGKDTFLDAVSNFGTHNKTLLKWVEDTCVSKNMSAPNDYVLVKKGEVGCYPEILKAKNILNLKFHYSGDVELVYLYSLKPKNKKGETIDVKQYSFFSVGLHLEFVEIKQEEEFSDFYFEISTHETFKERVSIGNDRYIVLERKMPNSSFVFPFGYKIDYNNYEKLYLPFWHKANYTLKDAIQDGSQYQIAKNHQVFLTQINYYEECKYNNSGDGICQNGKLSISGKECPNCKGSGRVGGSDGPLDKIEIKLPDDGMPVSVKPTDLQHYVEPPTTLLKELREISGSYYNKASMDIYGVDMSQKANSPVTATQVLEQQGTGHSVVIEFLASPESLYNSIARAISLLLDVKGALIEFSYSSDISVTTEMDILNKLEKAKSAGAPTYVIAAINASLEEKQSKTKVRDNEIVKILEEHKPFANLTESTAVQFVLTLKETDPKRVRWEHFNQITSQIKYEHPRFAEKSYKEREAIISNIVGDKIQDIKDELEKELSFEMQKNIDN